MAFDQIYYEHLLFYTLKTIEVLLQRHGLSMFDAQLASIHGGSIIGYVTHQSRNLKPSDRLERMRAMEDLEKTNERETYLDFAERIKVMKEFNLQYLRDTKRRERRYMALVCR